jgi:hypothetical protein
MGLKILYISSAQREDISGQQSNNFTFHTNESMYGSYRLKAVSVPNTVYTIDGSGQQVNNIMNIIAGGVTYTLNMPNYYISDGNTLSTLLQNALNAITFAGATSFVVSYNNYTSKLLFTVTTVLAAPIQFYFPTSGSLAGILGFAPGVFYNLTLTAAGPPAVYSISSATIVNLTRIPAIFIKINQFNNYLQVAKTGVNYTFMLPNNVSSLYFIDSFFDQTGVLNQFANLLDISLRDENGRLVDIQNVDWYMVLESTC